MRQNSQQLCSLRMRISIIIVSTVFLLAQVGSCFSAPPPPRGGHGGGPPHGGGGAPHGGPGYGGGGPHHGEGPSAGAVIGTAIGALAVGAIINEALQPKNPPPAPAVVPPPSPAVVPPPSPAPHPIPPGKVFSVLPAGYTALLVGDTLYYYYMGSYYRLTSSGYVVVRPPAGAVIPTLPSGCATIMHNGATYFSYGGVYYRQVANGYEVITDLTSVSVPQPLAATGKIMVTSKRLNVRSGPGTHNSVVCTVYSGDTLQIVGNAPGWYYVRLPNGSSGWVMAKFTTPLAQPADG